MQTLRLGDVCKKIGSGATPRGGSDVYLESGVALIRSQNVYNDGFHPDGLAFIGEKHATELSNVEVQAGDVLLNITGDSVARSCRAPAHVLPARVNQHVGIIRPDASVLDPRFLHYFLVSPTKQSEMLSLAGGGATRNALTKGMIENFQIPAPSIDEQRSISEVLGSLDDKIEQNRRTGRKLEELARAVFKAWFVDFEPVKAKAAGAAGFPGMPAPAFAALPDRLVDSELGPVPEGWAIGTLGDVLKPRGDRVSPSDETVRLPYVPIDCITAKQVTLQEFKSGEEAQSSLIRFKEGDVLFGAMRPYFHKVCMAPFEGTTRTTCFVLVPAPRDRAFALMLASDSGTIEFATNHSVGSTIPYAKWENSLADMACVLPSPESRAHFGEVGDPLLALANELTVESRKLAALRDYLLPRLLSGQVRVGQTAIAGKV